MRILLVAHLCKIYKTFIICAHAPDIVVLSKDSVLLLWNHEWNVEKTTKIPHLRISSLSRSRSKINLLEKKKKILSSCSGRRRRRTRRQNVEKEKKLFSNKASISKCIMCLGVLGKKKMFLQLFLGPSMSFNRCLKLSQ